MIPQNPTGFGSQASATAVVSMANPGYPELALESGQ
jgi:hypothetical protein